MSSWINLNGRFVERGEAKISIFDHGLLYGDGVFEGIRSYKGKIFRLDEHVRRLYRSAHFILLEPPLSPEKMKEEIILTVRKNRLEDAYIRVVITRGEGDLGLDPEKCSNPSYFIIADKIQLYPDEFYKRGLEIVTVSTRRNPLFSLDPQVKSLNYLNNILAKIQGRKAGCVEALMLDRDGWVLECTGDNIFIVENGRLITPPTFIGVLEGITRNVVIELAKKIGIPCCEELFSCYRLYNADECFLTGTAAEIVPVVRVDDRRIGDGKPGEITQKIRTEFRRVTKEGTPVYNGEKEH
ncbi:branched-chain-amino-acid transaminase [Candidatus Calescamantes bacterium]|nr:branched-chain-amino-acid transaminase [Candidatus Calescamantes bacterium]